ncbi:MAG: neutral zinc metallopeptidase [Limimaricola sp.]|uniref:metallopeptidase family protein n=1 Tax=Limimaricola sp. TaxID=2211665 RepID=UPI001DD554F9|nr:metallopeptidase family protein [Limimaricola sp.]MBI1415794.1 neutral zinc metallopeptidase [Limimaricola sp.]
MSSTDPSPEDILRIAEATVAAFPPQFRGHAVMVEIVVEDLIPDEMLEEGEDPWDITGLYTGVPLTHKRYDDIPDGPDTVWLFRAPILEELQDRPGVTLDELVAHVTVHEFAHHFGWSDDQIAAIDQWWT